MGEKNETESWVGVIPDFFHDILAYLIPGYAAIVLFYVDLRLIGDPSPLNGETSGFLGTIAAFVCAYVLGRAFEQVGYVTIHKNECFGLGRERKPKWRLLFDDKDDFYTATFKATLKRKIAHWLENQDGEALLRESKEPPRDEYFNLIQFYLRERFPAVALYEKKQNAAIVLSRSLAVMFFFNIIIYHALLFTVSVGRNHLHPDYMVMLWLSVNVLLCWTFYYRFIQDNRYHAMYIFETFIATKRLLKKKKADVEPTSSRVN